MFAIRKLFTKGKLVVSNGNLMRKASTLVPCIASHMNTKVNSKSLKMLLEDYEGNIGKILLDVKDITAIEDKKFKTASLFSEIVSQLQFDQGSVDMLFQNENFKNLFADVAEILRYHYFSLRVWGEIAVAFVNFLGYLREKDAFDSNFIVNAKYSLRELSCFLFLREFEVLNVSDFHYIGLYCFSMVKLSHLRETEKSDFISSNELEKVIKEFCNAFSLSLNSKNYLSLLSESIINDSIGVDLTRVFGFLSINFLRSSTSVKQKLLIDFMMIIRSDIFVQKISMSNWTEILSYLSKLVGKQYPLVAEQSLLVINAALSSLTLKILSNSEFSINELMGFLEVLSVYNSISNVNIEEILQLSWLNLLIMFKRNFLVIEPLCFIHCLNLFSLLDDRLQVFLFSDLTSIFLLHFPIEIGKNSKWNSTNFAKLLVSLGSISKKHSKNSLFQFCILVILEQFTCIPNNLILEDCVEVLCSLCVDTPSIVFRSKLVGHAIHLLCDFITSSHDLNSLTDANLVKLIFMCSVGNVRCNTLIAAVVVELEQRSVTLDTLSLSSAKLIQEHTVVQILPRSFNILLLSNLFYSIVPYMRHLKSKFSLLLINSMYYNFMIQPNFDDSSCIHAFSVILWSLSFIKFNTAFWKPLELAALFSFFEIIAGRITNLSGQFGIGKQRQIYVFYLTLSSYSSMPEFKSYNASISKIRRLLLNTFPTFKDQFIFDNIEGSSSSLHKSVFDTISKILVLFNEAVRDEEFVNSLSYDNSSLGFGRQFLTPMKLAVEYVTSIGYVADLCIPELKLIIEVNGPYHYYLDKPIGHQSSMARIATSRSSPDPLSILMIKNRKTKSHAPTVEKSSGYTTLGLLHSYQLRQMQLQHAGYECVFVSYQELANFKLKSMKEKVDIVSALSPQLRKMIKATQIYYKFKKMKNPGNVYYKNE